MSESKVAPAAPLRPEERINEFSAQQDDPHRSSMPAEDLTIEESVDFGSMNEADARASGYIGNDGRAIETAKPHDGTRLGSEL